MLIVISILMAVTGMTLIILRLRPPQGDREPISREALNDIIRLECQRGDKL